LTALQAILMALLQGVTELFPVSSLGHAVILPRLLNWGVDLKAPDWLAYLVVMHLGTSLSY
jgi:undecaprenyl-diphosphatase